FVASVYNAASSAGNIVGPLLFNSKDAPTYHPGLRDCLAIFIALVVVVALQWVNLIWLNKRQEKKRVANGKPAKMVDHSMEKHYHDFAEDNKTAGMVGEVEQVERTEHGGLEMQEGIGENAFLDLTDRQNDEFVYIY
ncbi:hypothetical protein F66182_16720, partial [Fusarium sp. NRRL 66182]